MNNHDEAAGVRPLTLTWVNRHLEAGERVVGAQALHGGITADMRRLTIGTRDGDTRHLVLRTFVNMEHAEDWLNREAGALTLLAGTGVPAPGLVAVDPTAAQCEYPSLLMTHLAGRTVLDDEGLETRVPRLARQLVAIHAVRPAVRPREYVALTTADTVVTPKGADAAAWAAAIDVIRKPAPPYEGRFLHRDFQPGNVLFDVEPSRPASARITGVVDWAGASWGPADLDVAHCSTNLALLHGPAWGLRFAEAYEEAGGVLAATASERLYWQVRDGLACSEEVRLVSRPWREAGRTELTTRAVEERLDAYVTAVMDALG
ncbi:MULTISPECIES: phosphotransferase family protein [Streptomyces]|uniref:Aminoglycoside phosphotransferase family protein n=2 Tax=Streptomyces violaceusniger group TaxID=2839105 RepID=A0ABD5JE90_9ACTN|nr:MULTISPECIES: aminoglycoside phosphotransferase family protein [Streptomyces]KUL65027.1 aminoglycoside phosphotransferase [Streptomyces violaceusniger]MEE4585912.1 aminoglycoside phosphotransferase family protein [Streptomyces sp. DSM 41602]QTI87782.1 aminoglycoside phosphotransferase family protein [Streptomyces sp. AgN23]